MAHAEAYKDPGTPEEISRRTFMAKAVTVASGVIGVTLAIPLLASLAPAAGAAGPTWSGLDASQLDMLKKATDSPVKLTFNVKSKDGYLPESNNEQFVWGIKVPPEKQAKFRQARPDLFASTDGKVDYEVFNMGFVMFSSICPHLGCKFNYDQGSKKFACPCHGSQFEAESGEHIAGPAPRGLDPLPFREQAGNAEITWIDYATGEPARIIVAYT